MQASEPGFFGKVLHGIDTGLGYVGGGLSWAVGGLMKFASEYDEATHGNISRRLAKDHGLYVNLSKYSKTSTKYQQYMQEMQEEDELEGYYKDRDDMDYQEDEHEAYDAPSFEGSFESQIDCPDSSGYDYSSMIDDDL